MPRNALQHSHMPLHVCTSTQSQNKVSLCTHRGIFICTDITGGQDASGKCTQRPAGLHTQGEASGRAQATCIFLPA